MKKRVKKYVRNKTDNVKHVKSHLINTFTLTTLLPSVLAVPIVSKIYKHYVQNVITTSLSQKQSANKKYKQQYLIL